MTDPTTPAPPDDARDSAPRAATTASESPDAERPTPSGEPRPRPHPSALAFWITAAIAFAVDQVTKILVDFVDPPLHRAVIPGFFDLWYVPNDGGAWGFLSGARESFRMPFLIATSVLAIAFLIFLRGRLHLRRRWTGWAFPVVLGGAIGNLVDRIRLGYVIDFLDFYVAGTHWPTFNVADICITVGVGMLLLDSFMPEAPATTSTSTTTTTTTSTGTETEG